MKQKKAQVDSQKNITQQKSNAEGKRHNFKKTATLESLAGLSQGEQLFKKLRTFKLWKESENTVT